VECSGLTHRVVAIKSRLRLDLPCRLQSKPSSRLVASCHRETRAATQAITGRLDRRQCGEKRYFTPASTLLTTVRPAYEHPNRRQPGAEVVTRMLLISERSLLARAKHRHRAGCWNQAYLAESAGDLQFISTRVSTSTVALVIAISVSTIDRRPKLVSCARKVLHTDSTVPADSLTS